MMLRGLLVLLLLAFVGSSVPINEEDNVADLFRRGFEEYVRTGQETEELQKAYQQLQFPGLFRRNYINSPKIPGLCLTCKVAIDTIINQVRDGKSGDEVADYLIELCVKLGIEPDNICRGTVNSQKDTLEYIINSRSELNGKRVCAILLQSENCKDNTLKDWLIDIPKKPELPYYGSNQSLSPPVKATPLKVLQLTDIHYDPDYTVGSNANCKEPLCCQPGSKPESDIDAAGYWGDYRGCDTPWPVLVDSLDHIVTQHKNLDYIYYTGDIIDHKVWETNISRNSETIKKVLNQFKVTFGKVPIFPILGNHEPHPVNAFSSDGINGPEISTKWIFELSAEEWKHWLPSETRDTILKGGYYTAKLPGQPYRIIALNSNVCFTFNWWLLFDDNDPFDQLKWLVEVLTEAETKGEKVHIISHVPTADDTCWYNWGREYSKIVRRFASTISAQFNGHTHKKENVIYYDSDNLDNPVSIAFNGGSLTSYHNVNPNYVVYDIDSDNAEVQDYELWIYDVEKANKEPILAPKWEKLYSFKEDYNIGEPRITPTVMDELVKSFVENDDLITQYYKFKYRNARPELENGCDDKCHLQNLCYMVTNYHGENSHCKEIERLWKNKPPQPEPEPEPEPEPTRVKNRT